MTLKVFLLCCIGFTTSVEEDKLIVMSFCTIVAEFSTPSLSEYAKVILTVCVVATLNV
jgi:hypothetical protein